jgi:hypothetical protein
LRLFDGQAGGVLVEEALDEQIVLQQTTAAAPAQFAQITFVQQFSLHG